jgi:hypothetical protein
MLLGNDSEISKFVTAVSKQGICKHACSYGISYTVLKEAVFSIGPCRDVTSKVSWLMVFCTEPVLTEG